MKIRLKAASNRMAALLFFALCGCAESGTWLTGEPGPEITGTASVVKGPEGLDSLPWPNLADVPSVRPAFSDDEDERLAQEEMLSDSYQAQAQAARVRAEPVPQAQEGFLSISRP